MSSRRVPDGQSDAASDLPRSFLHPPALALSPFGPVRGLPGGRYISFFSACHLEQLLVQRHETRGPRRSGRRNRIGTSGPLHRGPHERVIGAQATDAGGLHFQQLLLLGCRGMPGTHPVTVEPQLLRTTFST